MLQFEAQLLSKKKEKKKKILLTVMFTPIKTVYLIPFHITQAISKKIHQFVKDILHRTVNRAQSIGIRKNLLSLVKVFLCSLLVYTPYFRSNRDSLQTNVSKSYLYSIHR